MTAHRAPARWGPPVPLLPFLLPLLMIAIGTRLLVVRSRPERMSALPPAASTDGVMRMVFWMETVLIRVFLVVGFRKRWRCC